ncbi:MAG: bifunctional ornithine acetyltransferase/N-acetylglutamate synthase, partial [Bacillota bacterium]
QGKIDALKMAEETAEGLDLSVKDVLVASTGVIGVPLPMEKVVGGIQTVVGSLHPGGGIDAAAAILTTDLTVKETAYSFLIGDKEIKIGAIAKGSGMIHPNMATMLCFITTDLSIERGALDRALKKAVDGSFNMLTVDGDTSTNDLVLVLANGAAGNDQLTEDQSEYELFVAVLTQVCVDLARKIAKDGEGATKFLEVLVKGGESVQTARVVAKSVAASSLVKTALFGEDPNWGRILCAAGYSGAQFNPEAVDIYLKSRAGEVKVAARGSGAVFDEDLAKAILREAEITIRLDLHQGKEIGLAFGCDFSYDYVKINAEYRT